MKNTINVLKKIIPNEIEVLKRRYAILKGIERHQPIGRRHLAQVLQDTEKVIRNETYFLKSYEYINVSASGMTITEEGKDIINELDVMMHYLKGLTGLETLIKKALKCDDVVIVPGNVDHVETVKLDIGKAAADVLLRHIKGNSIVAITGGSTSYSVIHSVKKVSKTFKDVTVLPARGSLRDNVEFQANTLAAVLAGKIGAQYELLNIPDNLSSKALESVRKEPEIQKTIEKIINADVILFGIGNANEMAIRRHLPDTLRDYLKRKEAIAEALGYYFNKNGEIVYTSRSIGIKLEQMTKLAYPIAVAGGKSKAKSILAVRHFIRKGCLVMDEGAANEIIQLLN